MIIIKNKIAIDKMRYAGHALSEILENVKESMKPGVSSFEIDAIIEKKMISSGLKAVCKGYAGYKHATLIS